MKTHGDCNKSVRVLVYPKKQTIMQFVCHWRTFPGKTAELYAVDEQKRNGEHPKKSFYCAID